MQAFSETLLDLYRHSREQPPEQFQAATMQQVRSHLKFASAVWGAGRVNPSRTSLTPSFLHTVDLDPEFSVQWAQRNHKDPIIRWLPNHYGVVRAVEVRETYRHVPESIEAGRRYGIRSFAVVGVPGSAPDAAYWLCLYQPSRLLDANAEQLRWLSELVPHMTEAFRINQVLHGASELWHSQAGLAVVEASTGRLIRSDDLFVQAMAAEWRGLQDSTLPEVVRRQWQNDAKFIFLGRHVQIDGRRSGELIYLRAGASEADGRLTARQLQIAGHYVEGLSTKEIARKLGISHSTVRNHIATIYATLNVHGKLAMAQRLERVLSA